jgi:hypothetical protein
MPQLDRTLLCSADTPMSRLFQLKRRRETPLAHFSPQGLKSDPDHSENAFSSQPFSITTLCVVVLKLTVLQPYTQHSTGKKLQQEKGSYQWKYFLW